MTQKERNRGNRNRWSNSEGTVRTRNRHRYREIGIWTRIPWSLTLEKIKMVFVLETMHLKMAPLVVKDCFKTWDSLLLRSVSKETGRNGRRREDWTERLSE
jgi:hypothetical protein